MRFTEFFQLFVESINLFDKIKTRSTKDIWKLANDIRKYPEDYDESDLIILLNENYNVQNGFSISSSQYPANSYPYNFPPVFAIFDGTNILVGVKHESKDLPYFFKFQPKDMEKVLGGDDGHFNHIRTVERVCSYFTKIIGDIGHANQTIDEIEYGEPREISGNRRRKGGSSFSSLVRRLKLDDDDDEESYRAFHDLINQHTKDDTPYVSRNDAKKTHLKDKIKQHTKTLKKYKFDEKDYVTLFKLYEIKAADIYHSLIDQSFDLPKHPSEIPSELHNIPRHLLKSLYYHHATPIILAVDSARGGQTPYSSYDQHYVSSWIRITSPEISPEHQPTKKEAYSWLVDLGKVNNKNQDRIVNFPSWLYAQTTGTQNDDLPNISFQSWLTFRWFLYNHKSTYFTKTQEVHGPAGQVNKVEPISIISKILDIDLTNGVKTSPVKAYQNSAERIAKAWEERQKNTTFVNYPRNYKDTPDARVVWSAEELRDEGDRLNHCVGGYGPSCERGTSLIVRLRNSTAELDPETLNIYQHRGTQNSSPPDEDVEHLKQWLDANNASNVKNFEF